MMRNSPRALVDLLIPTSMLALAVSGCSPEVEMYCSHARELCSNADDANCNVQATACAGDTLWAKRYSVTEGVTWTEGISVDGAGNATLNLQISGGINIAPPIGPIDPVSGGRAAIVKLDAAGNPFLGVFIHGCVLGHSALSDTLGNTLVAGAFQFPSLRTPDGQTYASVAAEDSLLLSLDTWGNLTLTTPLNATSEVDRPRLDSSPSGDILIGGNVFGSVDLGGGPIHNTFLGRFSANGAHVFSKQLPNIQLQTARFDVHGNIIISGYFNWMPNLQKDYLVAKFGPNGEPIWSKQFSGNKAIPSLLAVRSDALGNIYLSGGFHGTLDLGGGPQTSTAPGDSPEAFLVKLDPDGNYLWGKYFGNGDAQWLGSAAVDVNGNVIIGVIFSGSIDFGTGILEAASPMTPDVAIAKFTPHGDPIWSKRFGVGNEITVNHPAVGPKGEVFLLGRVKGDIDFGTGILQATTDNTDVFVVKLAP